MKFIKKLSPTSAILSARVLRPASIERLEDRIAPAYFGALAGTTATLTGDSASDTLIITAVNGMLSHNRFAAGDPGFASAFDFDSTTPGVQMLAADPASSVNISTGAGADAVLLGGDHHAAQLKAKFTVLNENAADGTLEVNDSAAAAPVNLTVSATGIMGSGFQITQTGIPFGTVTLRTGAGADIIGVVGASAALTAIDSGPGNDTVTGNNGALLPLRINGGDGSDTLTGGQGNDEIHGGAGNDLIIGGRGSDALFGEGGLDTFVWNPGDGSDIIDGGSGADQLVFNGANVNEQYHLFAQGGFFQLTRDVGNITMTTTNVEHLDLTTLGGADTVTVSDLSTTSMKTLHINSSINGAPDGQLDTLNVIGSDFDDHFRVDTTSSGVQVRGNSALISLTGFDSTDRLIVDGGLGTDNVFATSRAFAALSVALIGETSSNAHGTVHFATAASYDAGVSPISLASDNLFGTGSLVSNDLVVADAKTNSVLILPNNGDGTFLSAIQMSTGGAAPRGVVIADFNHDSHPDIAVTNSASGNVSVFLNAGDGTFDAPSLFATTKTPGVLRAADVTGDGETDLVMTSAGNTITILPGHGDGTFGAPIKLATGGSSPSDLAIADFSGDGRLDIAVASGGSDSVTLLDANPDFSFAKPVATHVGVKPTALVTGDFDGDGHADLAVTHGVSHFISLLLNASPGDGAFSSKIKLTHRGDNAPGAITAGDLDGDGRTDLVVGNTAAGTVSVYLNLGPGVFAPPVTLHLDNTPPRHTSAVVLEDFNGDGLLDIAAANAGSGDVSILTSIDF